MTIHRRPLAVRASLDTLNLYFLVDMPPQLLALCYAGEKCQTHSEKNLSKKKKNEILVKQNCKIRFSLRIYLPSKLRLQQTYRTKRYFPCCFNCCQTITECAISLLPPSYDNKCQHIWDTTVAAAALIPILPNYHIQV